MRRHRLSPAEAASIQQNRIEMPSLPAHMQIPCRTIAGGPLLCRTPEDAVMNLRDEGAMDNWRASVCAKCSNVLGCATNALLRAGNRLVLADRLQPESMNASRKLNQFCFPQSAHGLIGIQTQPIHSSSSRIGAP